MDHSDLLRFLYLGLVLVAVVWGVLASSRGRVGKTLRQAGAWVVIFGGTVLAVASYQGAGFLPFQSQTTLSDGRIELALQPDGHYYLTALVNDVPIEFVVDTGATQVVLSQEDARRAGIHLDGLRFIGTASTANGLVRTAPVHLGTLQVGDMIDKNLRAVVNAGPMEGSLLGMSYLSRFEKIEITRGRLILTR